MKKKLILSALLLTAAVAVMSISASALGAFADVQDPVTARNVEVLHLMGVVDGTGDGRFAPAKTLTRAEFCKMVVVLSGGADMVDRYKAVTIFPDVRSNHWAARYVNYAVRGEAKLIAGLPDGTFAPDRSITAGEAVTILMRLLGYTDADAGIVWPDGYMALAKSAGLTLNLTLSGNTVLTRAQAAQLFVNALAASGKDGSKLYPLGEETTLISVGGSTMRTTAGSLTMAKPVSGTLLAGLKGYVIKDKNDKVLTFLPKEKVDSTVTSSAAVIIEANGSTAGISALTGGRSDYKLYKNGRAISAAKLAEYDVATYDASTNTVYVCDTRVSVYYEAAQPSLTEPSVVTALGHSFSVLPSAQSSVAQFRPGKIVTLLLTENGEIAAMSDSVNGNALGVVNGTKLTMFCGSGSIELTCEQSSKYDGRAVTVSSSRAGTMSLYVQYSKVNGALDATLGTIGDRKIADDALIYDDGVLTSLAELGTVTIPAEKINYVRTNKSGEANLIILSGSTGEIYGRADVTKISNTLWSVSVSDGKTVCGPYETIQEVNRNCFVAAKMNNDGDGYYSLIALPKAADVTKSAWIGTSAVNFNGRTWPVSNSVLCYNADSGTWFDSLDDALAYGGSMSLYEKDGMIRIIEVRG